MTPGKFWQEIKCLSGRTTEPDTYPVDNIDDKLFTNNDKERLFTTIWDRIYSEDYDNAFNNNHQELDYMASAVQQTYPYNNPDPAVSLALLLWTVLSLPVSWLPL